MSQTSLPLTSHHFWLKRPYDLSSSVHSMTLLSSLTFSGPFNISYIFLTWQTMFSDPQLTGGSVLPALLWNRACCSIQPVPAQCFLTAYFKVVFKVMSFILGSTQHEKKLTKPLCKPQKKAFKIIYPLIPTSNVHPELEPAISFGNSGVFIAMASTYSGSWLQFSSSEVVCP